MIMIFKKKRNNLKCSAFRQFLLEVKLRMLLRDNFAVSIEEVTIPTN